MKDAQTPPCSIAASLRPAPPPWPSGGLGGTPARAGHRAGLGTGLEELVGDAKPVEGKVTIDLPEIAENGNTVPFTVSVESPMTENDYVKAIHVISTANPAPGVATFRFTPAVGQGQAAEPHAAGQHAGCDRLAELSDGKFLMGRRTVKVTIGGCGG